jgi:fumarate hydratase, class II
MDYRIESDPLGPVKIPVTKYWGAQTERSRNNFRIGPEGSMPAEITRAFGFVKKASAITNHAFGLLSTEKKDLITGVCDEIISGRLSDQFPLVIWQTGSGTQTNMNVNEVIANRAHVRKGGRLTEKQRDLHPNDDVNMSQSSNDTFPTAMHIAVYTAVMEKTLPGLERLRESLLSKSEEYSTIIKIGRTHLMDAVPLTLGQEMSAYVRQLENGINSIKFALEEVRELALGGSAVGTGVNTPDGFAAKAASVIAELTGYPFISAPNKFEALAAHDAMVGISSALKRVAVSLTKIANDIRLLSSGPRSGIGELRLPANEPGSSIMPGKVNPTQSEALTMVCAQVIANDVAVSTGGSNGHLELNVYKPLIAANVLQSANLLADASLSFCMNCIEGMEPDTEKIKTHLDNSLMLVTTLSPHIGYEKSAFIAKKAFSENITLREAALGSGLVTEDQFDEWVNPSKMI